MEAIHIHKLTVRFRNQVINFKINLPTNAKEITGIYVTENSEVSVNGVNVFGNKNIKLLSNLQVGRLSLKQRGKPNTFFGYDLIRNDNSLRYGDFPALDFYQLGEGVLPDFYEHDWWTAGSKWEAFPCEINPVSNVLLGYYKDRIILGATNVTQYVVTIYLKYKLKSNLSCVPN